MDTVPQSTSCTSIVLTENEIDSREAAMKRYRELPEILDCYMDLLEQYRRLRSDFEEARDSRERYKQMARNQSRNPFVLVLVDGDAYVFNETFFSSGADGGIEAALALNDAVQDELRQHGLEHCQIMVHVLANVNGLSKALHRAGLAGPEKRSMSPWIANFNRAYGLCEMIDAGDLKENVAFKLRDLLGLFADSAQCSHIFFAGCHDVSYISALLPYKDNSSRFTLLNAGCIHFDHGFTKLGMRVATLLGVFRSVALDQASSAEIPFAPAKSGRCWSKSTSQRSINWRTASKPERQDNYHASNTIEPKASCDFTQLPETIPSSSIAVNENGYRLDTYLTDAAKESYKAYKNAFGKPCNSFHLTGSCRWGDKCHYKHEQMEMSAKEVLRSLNRKKTVCRQLGECRSAGCTYRHICLQARCYHHDKRVFCSMPRAAHPKSFNYTILSAASSEEDSIQDHHYDGHSHHIEGSQLSYGSS